MSTDTRMVYGARCAWWGTIHDVASNGGIPCCPTCGSPLFEMDSPETWWAGVDRFDATHPGYRKMMEWSTGRHFKSAADMAAAYAAATGIVVNLGAPQ